MEEKNSYQRIQEILMNDCCERQALNRSYQLRAQIQERAEAEEQTRLMIERIKHRKNIPNDRSV